MGVGVIQRGVDSEVGELGDGAGYFGEGGLAVDVARDDVGEHMAAQDAELAGDFGFVALGLQLLPVCELGVIVGRERARQPLGEQIKIERLVGELALQPEGERGGGVEHGDCGWGMGRMRGF